MRSVGSQSGFVTLAFVLVMAAVLLTVAVAGSLRSIENLQLGYWHAQADVARSASLACLEDGLLRLRSQWVDSSAMLSLPDSSCTIQIATTPSAATAIAKGTIGSANRTITVTVSPALQITDWGE